MKGKQKQAIVIGLLVFWYLAIIVFIISPQKQVENVSEESVEKQVATIEGQLKHQANLLKQLQQQVLKEQKLALEAIKHQNELDKAKISSTTKPRRRKLPPLRESTKQQKAKPNQDTIAVLMMACNRVNVSRALDKVIKYRPSADQFPLVVSQDCGDRPTAAVIKSYKAHVQHSIKQPDMSKINVPPKEAYLGEGYFKISRHYKWALNYTFYMLGYPNVIILEDDLDIAPDFFSYFASLLPVLRSDKTLWCVSAWNDNGNPKLVENNPELLYRSDFFPGLGWMLEKRVWDELHNKFPAAFWDDWMRQPAQRKERACIRPEVSRTYTFGKKGVSRSQFFDKFLAHIKLNDKAVDWSSKNLSYLHASSFDVAWVDQVYKCPMLSLSELQDGQMSDEPCVRLQYSTALEYKTAALYLGLMEDLKSGVGRTAYRGVVTCYKNKQRIYLAPPSNWRGYDVSW